MKLVKGTITAALLFLAFFIRPELSFASAKINPIVWKTSYNQLASSDFHIRIGNQYFYGVEPMRITSDPGTSYTTLENIWKENGIEMRLFMYFKKIDTNMWEMYDLRAYNATGSDWIYYSPKDSLGNTISSLLGYRNFSSERIFLPTASGIDAEIYCKDCSITAFMPQLVPLSIYGYGIDFRVGIPKNETITLSTDPMSGYGVNASLVDSSQEVVKDQSNFTYRWSLANEQIATLSPQSIPYPDGKCAYEILPPCPPINVQIVGKNPGVTQVLLEIRRKSDQVIAASGSFDIKVVEMVKEVIFSPAPTISPSSTPSQEVVRLQKELSQLQGEVGNIKNDVVAQKEEINVIQKILTQIQEFFRRFFQK